MEIGVQVIGLGILKFIYQDQGELELYWFLQGLKFILQVVSVLRVGVLIRRGYSGGVGVL